jgi:hypothetical protein
MVPTATPEVGQNGLTAVPVVEATHIPTRDAAATNTAAVSALKIAVASSGKWSERSSMGRSDQIAGRQVNAIG